MSRTLIALALGGALMFTGAIGAQAHDRERGHGASEWDRGMGEHWRRGDRMSHRWWRRKAARRMKSRWRKMRGLQLYRADANKNGEVTWKEVETLRGKYFKKFDTNKDGQVSREEIAERVKKRIERRTKRILGWFDENGDGKITQSEFNAHAKKRFDWKDLDEDNKLSADELPISYYRARNIRERVKGSAN